MMTTTTCFQLQPAGYSFRTVIDPSLLPPKKRAAASCPSPATTTTGLGLQLQLAAGCSLPTTIQIQESLLPPKKRPTSSTTSACSSSSSLLLKASPRKKPMDYYVVVDAGAAGCARMAVALQQAGQAGVCGAMMTMGSKRARKASSRYSADVWTQ